MRATTARSQVPAGLFPPTTPAIDVPREPIARRSVAAAYAGEHCLGERPIWVVNLHGWTDEPVVDATPEGITLPRTLLFQTRAQYSFFREEPLNMKGPLVKSTESPIITLGWCTAAPTLIGFFNGVANTVEDTEKSLGRLETEFGDAHASVPLEYHVFYNQTGCDRPNTRFSCLEDIYEAFLQRDHELQGELSKRSELFWEAVSGHFQQDGFSSGTLDGRLRGNALTSFLSWTISALQMVANKLQMAAVSLANNPPTAADMAAQLAKLEAYDDRQIAAVLVAHSQGNLFANAAYDSFKAERDASKLRVVHVAPASPTLRGPYVLSDRDVVIDLLRRTSFGAAPSPNVEETNSPADPLGHSFADSYMNVSRPSYHKVRQLIVDGLDAL